MGFVKDSIRRTLFDKQSFTAAVHGADGNTNGYAVIKIIPDYNRTFSEGDNLAVVGIIQNGLSFDIDATWEQLGEISNLAPDVPGISDLLGIVDGASKALGSMSTAAGLAEVGSVYKSKKIYKRSGDINISPTIKIVDWNGTGQPILCAMTLASLVLPSNNFKDLPFVQDLQKIMDKAAYSVREMGRAVEPVVEGLVGGVKMAGQVLGDAATKLAPDAVPVIKQGMAVVNNAADAGGLLMKGIIQNAGKDADDMFTLRSSPVPVKVEIGNYFKRSDMVITRVSFKFSKECTKAGPLFVDIDISLSSRHILKDINDIGFGTKDSTVGAKNVSFTGGV